MRRRTKLNQSLQLTIKAMRQRTMHDKDGKPIDFGAEKTLFSDKELHLLQVVLDHVEPGPCHHPE
jgi:hypothetical protein